MDEREAVEYLVEYLSGRGWVCLTAGEAGKAKALAKLLAIDSLERQPSQDSDGEIDAAYFELVALLTPNEPDDDIGPPPPGADGEYPDPEIGMVC